MKDRGRLDSNTVVTTVMSNLGLYKALDAAGISYEKTAVGDKYVWENMREHGHLIGGEQSGHIIFSKYGHHRRRAHHRSQGHAGNAGYRAYAE